MAPTLYMIHPSPPSRAVMMTAKAINLDLNLKEVDVSTEEYLKPPYLKMNPEHTIPTLVDDDGYTIWNSHAIMIYLVSKYAKTDSLYPTDLQKRALVDQRLLFQSGVVFDYFRRIAVIEQENRASVVKSYGFLNAFLDGRKWSAGDCVTIADFSLLAAFGTLARVIPVDGKKFPRVSGWLKMCEDLPEYQVNKRGEKEMSRLLVILRISQTKNMAPTLYMSDLSAPVRGVLMTAKAIGLELNLKNIDFLRLEHRSEEYLQMNPQHTVPTLVDGDFILWESQAIMVYLVSKYANSDKLYPRDVKTRAVINQRLHFNTSVAFFHLMNIDKALLWYDDNVVPREDVEGILETYGFLETFLEGKEWVAGDFVTIADYSMVATVSTLDVLVPIDYEKFPNVLNWWFRCEDLSEYKANREGSKKMRQLLKRCLSHCSWQK